jgi:hypothetical protein
MAVVVVFAAHGQENIADKLIKKKAKKYQYEEVDFEDMMKRYFLKQSSHEIEGVYSVSCVITKRSKALLSRREKLRVVKRQDNYARVAIMKDWPGAKRDFIEVSLSYKDAKKYPIMGEINSSVSQTNGYVYKHIEPDGTILSFSMVGESDELLEGEFSKIQRRKTITYRLSYLKIYPKNQQVVLGGQ